MYFLDTDVLVDCLHGTIPAQGWLKQIATQSFAVPAGAGKGAAAGVECTFIMATVDNPCHGRIS
jgi:hypothetical protein